MNNLTISENEKLTFISGLGTMLSAGIPVLEAVNSILEDSKGGFAKLLTILAADLNQGRTVSESLSRFPQVFDPVTVSLIKAAEASGNLDTTLKDLSQTINKDMEFNQKVKSALAYPLLVVLVFLGVIILVLTQVIPRVAQVFTRLKVELPLPTQILIFISDSVLNSLPVILIVLGLLLASLYFVYRREKRVLLRLLSNLPLISGIAHQIDLTRFSRALSLLLSSGVPITTALELSASVVNKVSIQHSVLNILSSVSSGKTLSEGFKSARLIFPNIMVRITQAGEKTGTLDKSMEEVSAYFENQVTGKIKILTTVLEPVMLVVVGIFVGVVMLALIAPIYELITQLGTQ